LTWWCGKEWRLPKFIKAAEQMYANLPSPPNPAGAYSINFIFFWKLEII